MQVREKAHDCLRGRQAESSIRVYEGEPITTKTSETPPQARQTLALTLALNPRRLTSQTFKTGDGRPKALRREVRVPHRHRQRGVAQQFLELLERHAAHDSPGRERVAQGVEIHVVELGGGDGVVVSRLDVAGLEPRPSAFRPRPTSAPYESAFNGTPSCAPGARHDAMTAAEGFAAAPTPWAAVQMAARLALA